MNYDFDLLVIGAGSGGVRAARMAAAAGKKVAVVENRYLGGTCVNVGCVPKKLFVYASEYPSKLEEARGFGIDSSFNAFSWDDLRDNKTQEIKRLNRIYENLLTDAGVTLIEGTASFKDAQTLYVDDKEYSAAKILIAVGGWPFKPDILGSDLAITSNEVFYLNEFPKRILIAGGGYIAVEFAGIFNGLGAQTELVYRGKEILRGFDDEIRQFAHAQISAKGVAVRTLAEITQIQPSQEEQGLLCDLSDGSQIVTDCVLFATGREPMTKGLNLKGVGVETRDDGTIIADEQFKTSVDGIYALGDVIGTPALTPVALEQAMTFVRQQYQQSSAKMDYQYIATAVFSQPSIGTIGLTEEQARQKFADDIEIYASSFKALKHTLSGSHERSLMKLVVQKSTDKVIGLHMVGSDAGEIIQGFSVAMRLGATKADFDATVGVHPTSAEEFVTMRSAR